MKSTPFILMAATTAAASPDGHGGQSLLAALWHWLGAGIASLITLLLLLLLGLRLWFWCLTRRSRALEAADGAEADAATITPATPAPPHTPRGFTLTELLCALAIIWILAALFAAAAGIRLREVRSDMGYLLWQHNERLDLAVEADDRRLAENCRELGTHLSASPR